MTKLWQWFRDHALGVSVLFLLAFIPLYPKLPLIHVIRTWVYVRLEDFFVALAVAIFLILEIRERHKLKSPLTVPIITYWVIGFISLINALIFIAPLIAGKGTGFFPHIALLHFFRRLEYMGLFFLAFRATTRRQLSLGLVSVVSVGTALAVFAYGIGQKFLGLPAYLTMNEEFAKGIPLRLPPTARVPSTFGGHYDLAAYLVLLIPLLGSFALGARNVWQKVIFATASVLSLVLLLLTASRVSFIVYLLAVTVMLVWQKKKILILPVIIVSFILLNLVSGTADRFYKTFRYSDVVVDLSTGKPIGTLDKIEGGSAIIKASESPAKESLPTGTNFINIPGKGDGNVQTKTVITSRDLATGSGELATISGSFLVQKALVYDISITTRFQGQWPRAIEAFKRNILLGSGYSSLSVAADGDYHRMLGETGILGTIAFLGILLFSFAYFLRYKDTLSPFSKSFVIGVFAGIVGLMLNAVLIDVFEASKVAFTLWLLLGIAIGTIYLSCEQSPQYLPFLRKFFFNPTAYVVYLVGIIFLLYGSTISFYFVGDDFTWLRWAAESSVRDLVNYFTQAQGFFYRPIPKLFTFFEFSVFWLTPAAYHIMLLGMFSTIVLCMYGILRDLHVRRVLAWSICLLFIVLSIHHENLIWISTQGHMLGAMFFSISLVLFSKLWLGRAKFTKLFIIAGYLSLFLAMLSSDPLVVAPVLIVLIGFLIYGVRNFSLYFVLLFIPLYAQMRYLAGALGPSGDYAYNSSKLLVNSVGNGITYGVSIFAGVPAMEYASTLRTSMRQHLGMVTTVVSIVGAIVLGMLYKTRVVLKANMTVLWWIVISFVSLVPYLGLGEVSERYTLLASLLLCIGLGVGVEKIWNKVAVIGRIIMTCVFLLILAWNYQQTTQRIAEWKFASFVSQDALLKFKNEFYPPVIPKNYIFVNVPIRYGRAWIFPVGLDDAIWHTMRLSEYYLYTLPTIEAAFDFDPPHSAKSKEVLYFDNYVLKHLVKEVQTVQ